jgi:hypothetical protein
MTAALTIRVELALSSSAEDLLSRLLRQDGAPKSIDTAPIYDVLIAMEERVEALHAAVQRAWQQPKAPVVDPEPVKNSAPASAQNWFRTTSSQRAALLLRVDGGMKPKDLAAELGVRLKSLHDTIYRARQERKLADGAEASTAQPEPAPAPPPSPAQQAATTVRTLDQHRAVSREVSEAVAAPPVQAAESPQYGQAKPVQKSAEAIRSNLPPVPKPSAPAPRQVVQELAAQMSEAERQGGLTRLPTMAEMASTGVQISFLNIGAASTWLKANGHSVQRSGPRSFKINGTTVDSSTFVTRAERIAREHAMKILKERRAG